MKDTDFAFGNLAPPSPESTQHIRDIPVHPVTGGCMGNVNCQLCRKEFGYCNELDAELNAPPNQENGEEQEMIPRSQHSNAGNGNRGQNKKGSGLDFLTIDMLSSEKEPIKILAARTQDDTFRPGNQLVAVKVQFKGKMLLWNLRPNNPNLDIVGDMFGDDETKWAGKSMLIFKEKDDFDNKEWMRVEADEKKK